MRGSLALWYEAIQKSQQLGLPVELHFNLWRDLETGSNFFDVGILIHDPRLIPANEKTDAKNGLLISRLLERFFFFIPGQFELGQVIDLSRIVVHGQTLNAVFNDVVTITAFHEHNFETAIEGSPHLVFHHIDKNNDLEIQAVQLDHDQVGTLITFRRSLCARFNKKGNHYVRLRFQLDRRTQDLFSSDSSPSDWFLLSSFSRTELTEFRLNERRSFPASIATRVADANAAYFLVDRIDYFLMRDKKFELIGAHTPFRKMRRLEQDLWRSYLRGLPPGGQLGWRTERALSRASERIIIYHWREMAEGRVKPFRDFIAFASFRSPIANLVIYAFVIVFLGAVGAGLHPVGVQVFNHIWGSFGSGPLSEILSNGAPIVFFFILAFFLPLAVKWIKRGLRLLRLAGQFIVNISCKIWRWGNGNFGNG